MEGTTLWIQTPGAAAMRGLFVGRIEGVDAPVVALQTPAGARVLAVVTDEEAEMELADLLGALPDAALEVGDPEGF
jgi:hypothetical protein